MNIYTNKKKKKKKKLLWILIFFIFFFLCVEFFFLLIALRWGVAQAQGLVGLIPRLAIHILDV
jgi:flagellar basal body-associated protein FliL